MFSVKKRIITATLWLVFALCWPLAQAGNVAINEQQDPITLSKHLHFFKEDKLLTVQQALQLPASRWQVLIGNPSFAPTKEAYWYRVRVQTKKDFKGFIEIDRPIIDDMAVYLLSGDTSQQLQQFQIGDMYPFDTRPVNHNNMVVPFEAKADSEVTVLLRVVGKITPLQQFEATLREEKAFYFHSRWVQMLHGLFFGAMLLVAFYNLFIYFSVREPAYLIYVISTLVICMPYFTVLGYSYEYLWPNSPEWNSSSLGLFNPIFRICVFLFCLRFLHLTENLLWAARLLQLMITIDLLFLIGYPFGVYSKQYLLFNITTLLGYPLALLSGIILWYRGVKEARYYTIAWFALTASWVIYAISIRGGIPYTPSYFNAVLSMQLLEAILFALALADRLNIAREKEIKFRIMSEQAANDARQLLETKNELLKAQIKQVESDQKVYQANAESKAKSAFLATMSHEIRTPMNGVLGMAEILKDTSLDDSQRRYVSIINDSGQALLSVINDILDFSKISSGRMNVESVDFDLEVLIDNCIEIFSLQCMEKKLQFVTCLEHGVPQTMRVDPTRLRQVLINLLGNATKFTEHGEITLKVSRSRNMSVEEALVFTVCDTGIGISEEQQQHLFESFSQAESSTTRRFGGTGLGLTISRQLVQLMGGEISINSEVGKGSCFTFSIPYLPASAGFGAQTPLYKSELNQKRLLIIDDNDTFCEFTQHSLRAWGIQSEIASNGQQALEMLRAAESQTQRYDLILLDIVLPDCNGYDLMGRIYTHDGITHIPPIIRISALRFGTTEQESTIAEKYATGPLLEKPITSARLRESIVSALGVKRKLRSQVEESQLSLPELTIMVAEDNPVNRQVIEGQLEKLGLQMQHVENGAQALQKVIDCAPYDLILMDCEMPQMDGYQATEKIREYEQGKDQHVKIIALTAYAGEEAQDKSLKAGMDDYLLKPVKYSQLQECLGQHFAQEVTSAASH